MIENIDTLMDLSKETQENDDMENIILHLEGDPGTGKTMAWKDFAKRINYELVIDLLGNQDSMDMGGMWAPDWDKGKLKHLVTDVYLGTDIPSEYDGRLIVMDEIGNAQAEMQGAILTLLQSRIHAGQKVPDNVIFGTAGNRPEHGEAAEMIQALRSRLFRIDWVVDHDRWLGWALENDIDSDIYYCIKWQKGLLHEFDPKSSEFGQPNPRSWTKLSDALKVAKSKGECSKELINMLATGFVGQGAGNQFCGFVSLASELATVDEILLNPDTAAIPTSNLGAQYASISNLSSYLSAKKKDGEDIPKEQADAIIEYIQRMDDPVAVAAMKSLYAANESITKTSLYGVFKARYDGYEDRIGTYYKPGHSTYTNITPDSEPLS